MTREIALHCMKSYSELHSDLCELCPIYGQTGSDHCFEDALQYVIGMLEQEPVLDKIRAEIKGKIEQEEFARSVFRHEEKDAVKAEQCTGSIMAYNNMIKFIDKYKGESEDKDGNYKDTNR